MAKMRRKSKKELQQLKKTICEVKKQRFFFLNNFVFVFFNKKKTLIT